MHKMPLTKLEQEGLEAHHLPIGKPSQLSDCFRQGIKWALDSLNNTVETTRPKTQKLSELQQSLRDFIK